MRTLWGACASSAPLVERAAFLVERLGVFGLSYAELQATPAEVIALEPRLSWCVNNCHHETVEAHVKLWVSSGKGLDNIIFGREQWLAETGIVAGNFA